MKSIKKIKKPRDPVEVESHGELINPPEDIIPEVVNNHVEAEEIPVEDMTTDQIKVENIDENGIPQFSDQQRKEMKEQMARMKR